MEYSRRHSSVMHRGMPAVTKIVTRAARNEAAHCLHVEFPRKQGRFAGSAYRSEATVMSSD